MTTPIEDRVATLEAWRDSNVDPALAQAQQAIVNLRQRVNTLETAATAFQLRLATLDTNYQDAVVRFQKAERLVARLRVIIGVIWKSTSTDRATYLSRLPQEERALAARDLEAINGLEHIGQREEPDEWREPADGKQ